MRNNAQLNIVLQITLNRTSDTTPLECGFAIFIISHKICTRVVMFFCLFGVGWGGGCGGGGGGVVWWWWRWGGVGVAVFQDYFELKRNTYDLRTKAQIIVPPARIVLGDKQIRIKGAQLWKRLPKDMLESRFEKSFKTILTKKCIASGTILTQDKSTD